MADACISLISSRTKCLPLCLKSIHDHFNKNYNYPIYVHYFDDIYTDYGSIAGSDSRNRCELIPNVEFIQVPYRTPEHIPEEELFYNRTDNAYVKKCFPKSRKGYLHMCNFVVNMYGYPNTKIHNHDYVIVFDDESGFVKDVPHPFLHQTVETGMAAMVTGPRLKDAKPPQNHIDTREGLWEFVYNFGGHFYSNPLSAEYFHHIHWSDGYVIRTDVFDTTLWKTWVEAINENGGIYKHRWGDNEIYSLFHYLHAGYPMPSIGLVEDGYLKQDLFRKIQNMAPGVKDNTR